jgi:hypothetical protein
MKYQFYGNTTDLYTNVLGRTPALYSKSVEIAASVAVLWTFPWTTGDASYRANISGVLGAAILFILCIYIGRRLIILKKLKKFNLLYAAQHITTFIVISL